MIVATRLVLALLPLAVYAGALEKRATPNKVVLTNDDGWAVAQIRAQNDALVAAGLNVILSAPAENESGTGSSTAAPTTLTEPCEFNTCPTGSPPTGNNATNTRLNYVNAFPVDSARFGIQTLSPQFFGGKPDIVVSGPNVGNNLGTTVQISGTVGAATEAAKEGIPSIAFSGATAAQVSFTTLTTDPTNVDSVAARIYAALSTTLTQKILASGAPLLPSNVSLNVNYPSTSGCGAASDFKFVLSRILADSGATDVETCGTDHLPTESSVVATSGCFASVSVMESKADVSASVQAVVLKKLGSLLSCLPS